MSTTSYYELLELSPQASSEEIKKAYRRLSMKYHPDKTGGDPSSTAKFQQISEAYETLSSKELRSKYDLVSGLETPIQPASVSGMGGLGLNISKPITVPVDKIFTGTLLPVEVERWIVEDDSGTKVTEVETIYVDIPKGIDDGEIILLKDKGNFCKSHKGELKLFVKIDNKTEFKRTGLDLLYHKSISLKEALCGFSFELKHLSGKTYTICNTNQVITNGFVKTIPKLGFARDAYVGNLNIIFDVKFPTSLNPTIVQQLAAIDF